MLQKTLIHRMYNDVRVLFTIVGIVLYLLAAHQYIYFVVPKYEYMGMLLEFNLLKSVVALVIYLSSFLLLFLKNSNFIRAFSSLLIILFLLPELLIFQFMDDNLHFILATIFMLVLINWTELLIPIPKAKRLMKKQVSLLLFILLVLFLIPFLLAYKTNFSSSLFQFGSELYAIRAEVSEDGNILTGYLLSPFVQYLLPMAAVYGLIERKWFLTILSVLVSIVIYSMIPQKSLFFGIFAVIFFYFFKNPLKKVVVFTTLIITVLIIGMYLVAAKDSLMVESLLLRRYLVVPAQLNIEYYNYFKEPLYYSYSFLKSFYTYPYDVMPPFLIGREVYHSNVTHANNGFMSDAYINLGLYGLYGFTFIVSLTLKYFDRLNIDARFFGIFFLLLNFFRSSALPTTFLTHGLWFFILTGFFILRRDEISNFLVTKKQ